MSEKKPANTPKKQTKIVTPAKIIKDGTSKPNASQPLKGSGKPTKRDKG